MFTTVPPSGKLVIVASYVTIAVTHGNDQYRINPTCGFTPGRATPFTVTLFGTKAASGDKTSINSTFLASAVPVFNMRTRYATVIPDSNN